MMTIQNLYSVRGAGSLGARHRRPRGGQGGRSSTRRRSQNHAFVAQDDGPPMAEVDQSNVVDINQGFFYLPLYLQPFVIQP